MSAEWVSVVLAFLVLLGGLIAAYTDLVARNRVQAARIDDLRSDVKSNYEYCHKVAHDNRDLISEVSAKVYLMEFRLNKSDRNPGV